MNLELNRYVYTNYIDFGPTSKKIFTNKSLITLKLFSDTINMTLIKTRC
jgi:hypothetical protein